MIQLNKYKKMYLMGEKQTDVCFACEVGVVWRKERYKMHFHFKINDSICD